MAFLSWSFQATDKIFSTRRAASGERSCPDGTLMSGYGLDSWGVWRSLCLAPLDVEDVEDVYLFVVMTVGIIVLGFAGFVNYRMLRKVARQQTKVKENCNNAADAAVRMRAELSTACEAVSRLKAELAASNEATARMSKAVARMRADITKTLDGMGKKERGEESGTWNQATDGSG